MDADGKIRCAMVDDDVRACAAAWWLVPTADDR